MSYKLKQKNRSANFSGMKRSSLKRMLESSESFETTTDIPHHEALKPAHVDLYSLPENLDVKVVETILNEFSENCNEIVSNEDFFRQIEKLNQAYTSNSRAREVHTASPEEYIESELALVETLRSFHAISLIESIYVMLSESTLPVLLIELLSHPNEDVAVEVLSLLVELTDETVVSGPEVSPFSECLVAGDILASLLLLFPRLSSTDDKVVLLQLLSNLLDTYPSVAIQLATPEWISHFAPILSGEVCYGQSLAVEVLIPVLHSIEPSNLGTLIDPAFIASIAEKVKLPLDQEHANNLYDLVCILAASLQLRPMFQSAIPEMSNHLKHLKATSECLRDCEINCNTFVESLGLKPLGAVLKRNCSEHALSICNSLLANCTGKSLERAVSKFAENSFEKTLAVLHVISEKIPKVRRDCGEANEENLFLWKCDNGLLELQQACVLIVRLTLLEPLQKVMLQLLANQPVQEIIFTVHEYIQLHPDELGTSLVDFQSLVL